MTDVRDLRDDLASVRARIAAAAARAGRDPAAVRLVAVTKTVGAGVVAELLRAGQLDFGENRPGDLVAKRAALADRAESDPGFGGAPGLPMPRTFARREGPGGRGDALAPVDCGPTARAVWHLIGHLQRNKVRRSLGAIDLLHTVDSQALADAVADEAARTGRVMPVLVQVNVSGEATKGGFSPGALRDALPRLRGIASISVRGLMTMAPWSRDAETARPVFRALRELRDWALGCGYLEGSELSMGMSEDFEVAVEEGATIVRVGRALVGRARENDADRSEPGAPSCRT